MRRNAGASTSPLCSVEEESCRQAPLRILSIILRQRHHDNASIAEGFDAATASCNHDGFDLLGPTHGKMITCSAG